MNSRFVISALLFMMVCCANTPSAGAPTNPLEPWRDEELVKTLKDLALHLEREQRSRRERSARPVQVEIQFVHANVARSWRPVKFDFTVPVIASRCFQRNGATVVEEPCPRTAVRPYSEGNYVRAQVRIDDATGLLAVIYLEPLVDDENAFGPYDVWLLLNASGTEVFAGCVPGLKSSQVALVTAAEKILSSSCTPYYVRLPNGRAVPWHLAPPE